eukprot:s1526_g3.t1
MKAVGAARGKRGTRSRLGYVCAICHRYWTCGTRHNVQPKKSQNYQWSEDKHQQWDSTWDEWESQSVAKRQATPSPGQRQPSAGPSPRSKTTGPKGKNKTKGKGKADKTSKANASGKGGSFSMPPWPTWDLTEAGISPFQSSTPSMPVAAEAASSSATLQEMAVQLRIAYQDPDSRPQDVQELLDRADKEAGKTNFKSIHAATRSLDKAQETLQNSIAAKKKHRLLWTKHVGEGIKVWEAQLEGYRVHQANLAEQAARARAEIAQARRIIQELSDNAVKGGNSAIPQPIKEEVEEFIVDVFDDPEEQQLRAALQGVLNACAGSLGIASEASQAKGIQEISDDDKDKAPHQKRQRSADPPLKGGADSKQ